MKRNILLALLITLFSAVCACVFLPACGNGADDSLNGAYYTLTEDGDLNFKNFYKLESGKWTDSDGRSGKYGYENGNLKFYYTLFGETKQYPADMDNNVLTVEKDGITFKYVSQEHTHAFSEWQTVNPTCIDDGYKSRSCNCGITNIQSLPADAKLHKPRKNYFNGNTYFSNSRSHTFKCDYCEQQIIAPHGLGACVCGYLYTYALNDDGTYSVTVNDNVLEEINIPNSYNNIPVTSARFFGYFSLLQNISIPANTLEVSIPSCSSLKTVTVDESNKAYSSEDGVLYDKTKNRLITVPQAFEEYLSIPQSVTEIGQGAFKGCSSLVGITVPGGVKTIADSAFANLGSLEKAVLSEGINSIGNNAFDGCFSLSEITLPNSLISIGDYAFSHCTSLTDVTLPDSLISIGNYAFYSCTALKSVTLPPSVTSVGDCAFHSCSALESIYIPLRVETIGSFAFEWCHALTIYAQAEEKPENWKIYWNSSNRPIIWGYEQ